MLARPRGRVPEWSSVRHALQLFVCNPSDKSEEVSDWQNGQRAFDLTRSIPGVAS
jgi:hypothetical protein